MRLVAQRASDRLWLTMGTFPYGTTLVFAVATPVIGGLLLRAIHDGAARWLPPPPWGELAAVAATLGTALLVLVALLGWTARAGVRGRIRIDPLSAVLVPLPLLPVGLAFAFAREPTGLRIEPETFVVMLILALGSAVSGELFHRGILLGALRGHGPETALGLSTAAFSLSHLVNRSLHGDPLGGAIQALATIGLGSICAGLRLRTGTIWPGVISHALNNAVVAVVGTLWTADNVLAFMLMLLATGLNVLIAWLVVTKTHIAQPDPGTVFVPPPQKPLEPLVATVGSPFWHALRSQLALRRDPRSPEERDGTKQATDVGSGMHMDKPLPGPWRADGHVVARMASVFPQRCIRCGRAANGQAARVKLWVRRPVSGLLVLALALIRMARLLNFYATRTHVSVFLCDRHQRARTIIRWGGAIAVAAGLLSVGIAVAQRQLSGSLGIASVVLLVAGIFAVSVARGPQLRGMRIVGRFIVIEGVGKGFRDTLPIFTSADDPYLLLGIPRSADETEIRRAYGRRVLELNEVPERDKSEQRDELDAALAVLVDPVRRARYEGRWPRVL